MNTVKHAESDEDIARCYAVMAELRPHQAEADFVPLVRHMMSEGYRLAWLEADGEVATVAGYRITTNLFMGRNLYVDDLVTPERCRSRGHGATMLRALRDIAVAAGCGHLHLDSGTQRTEAHRFYFREGLTVNSFHFATRLER